MRHTPARLNRVCLTLIGLLLLLAGLVAVLVGTGLLPRLRATTGLNLIGPAADERLLSASAASALSRPWVLVVIAAAGVALALLALAWLVKQIPRTNQAKPFRLHDNPADGLTRCPANVLADVLETELKSVPDVQGASAVLRGTVHEPDLTVKVTASERAVVPRLLQIIETQIAGDLESALDTKLRRLGVQVEIGATRSTNHQIALDAERAAIAG